MSINEKQIQAILSLPAPKRYSHFVKQVVGWKKAWGLYDDGWALSQTGAGEPVFPLWPAKEYAELCADGDWAGYRPEEIELEELLDRIIPMLREKEILPGVFYIVEGGSINADIDVLEKDLKMELSNYL
jgi:hypothetical protein